MAQITEDQLIGMLNGKSRILLIDPPYERKYMPLGLSKIATFARAKGSSVKFARGYDGLEYDLICMTTLFTMDWLIVRRTLRGIRMLNPTVPILMGGILASLMPQIIEKENLGISIFRGYSRILDTMIPSYDIDWGVDDPWNDYSMIFTSRGCPNACAYCAVKILEPESWLNPQWKSHIDPTRPNIMISDNNFSACDSDHIYDVIGHIHGMRKRILFDNGFDCKFINDNMAARLALLKYIRHGMRLSFDRISEDGIFQEAIRKIIAAGIPRSSIMAYILFNFNDIPRDADYRARECINLGIRPYPQQFIPLTYISRKIPFVGKNWTLELIRAFRYFWLMAGMHTKMTFDQALGSTLWPKRFRLGAADMEVWNRKIYPRDRNAPCAYTHHQLSGPS